MKGLIELYNGDNTRALATFKDGMRLDPDSKQCLAAFKTAKEMEGYKAEGNAMIKDKRFKEAI